MKSLIVLSSVILLASCSSTKKTTHSQVSSFDTATVRGTYMYQDTTRRSQNTDFNGLSVDVYYDTDTSALPAQAALDAAKKKPASGMFYMVDRKSPLSEVLQSFPNHSQITRIHLSVDSGKVSSTSTAGVTTKATVDSSAGKHVTAKIDTTEKTTRWPWWIYFGGILLILAVIYGILKRLKIIP